MVEAKIWFVTGASRGFGRLWTRAVLERGDKVAATARKLSAIADLKDEFGDQFLPMELDVTDHDGVGRAVHKAHRHFGRLDIVLSNAGYGLLGAVEEVGINEARANFETNVLGSLSVVQAAVSVMREQGRGHILAVSSVGGLVAFPMGGIYQATKFAVEGLMQTLALEVEQFGLKVTLIEPGPFKTDFMESSSLRHAAPLPAYDAAREQLAQALSPEMFGDPSATIKTLLSVVDAAEPPLHVMLGQQLLPMVKQIYAARIQSWEQWSDDVDH
ncbi:MAG: SDR family NAD(P)-dependent oxidoreductase [Sphingobium sp.]|uniref:SDR family NAD(P)-dependent oxidoreductase n=1 Tax=Sphingobium sp. CECT 9361 TaxID=2845384 RepID=UPI001E638B7E|nr:SDR family NAD(P)-dependent oxidoreductase [Sphingobium sp. CECT 9361]CAH0357054.1 3-phenylpropionate-dihydrodiol/cinnamic acid-dihydrodiol dehydrogenase [Sphingobium sp. CECT 9361]